jgi:hypothetical protein
MQIAAAGLLLRSLPNPLAPADLARLRDARPAGPPPQPDPEPLRVEQHHAKLIFGVDDLPAGKPR